MIKRAAVVGAAAWTAPLILSSAADAATAGTPKCQPNVTFDGGGGYKQHNNGSCGTSLFVRFNPPGTGSICPCGTTGSGQFINWTLTNHTGTAALYAGPSSLGLGVTSTGFIPASSFNSIDLFATPMGVTANPLPAGTYNIKVCALVRCCRTIGGVSHPSYDLEQLQLLVTVDSPCGPSITVASSIVGGTPSCSGFEAFAACS